MDLELVDPLAGGLGPRAGGQAPVLLEQVEGDVDKRVLALQRRLVLDLLVEPRLLDAKHAHEVLPEEVRVLVAEHEDRLARERREVVAGVSKRVPERSEGGLRGSGSQRSNAHDGDQGRVDCSGSNPFLPDCCSHAHRLPHPSPPFPPSIPNH
jgi:hypothetical protein